jgi:hypothetical protein
MSGAIPPLPNTPSWRGAHLKHRGSFTVSYIIYVDDIWDSSVSEVTGYRGSISDRGNDVSSSSPRPDPFCTPPPPSTTYSEGLYLVVKQQERATHYSVSAIEVNKERNFTSTSLYVYDPR